MRARVIVAGRASIALCCLALLAGCTGDEDRGTPAVTATEDAGEGGTFAWAVADRPTSGDPLTAANRAELILARQIHEPLVANLTGPFGDVRRRPGLARRIRPSRDEAVWTLELRRGVRFQDGSPFDTDAVLANAERWQASPAGRELLPGLAAVDAPRPYTVRFILSEPDARLPRRLQDPRLGIVAPQALAVVGTRRGLRREVEAGAGTGTGSFELRERSSDELLLARNTAWWGGAEDLGPALSQIVLRTEREPSIRLALLQRGEVQAADELGPDQATIARRDPLLAVLRGAGETALGLERSVRGIDSAREIPSLQGAWLTTLAAPN